MRIVALDISNFRGIRTARLVLPPHAVLVGSNNSGKSTIAESLAVLVGRERMTKPLSEWDFFGGCPTADSRFEIVATISEFASDDPETLPDWFAGERPAAHAWWHEATGTLSRESEPPNGTRLATQLAATGRFDPEEAEVDVIRFFFSGACDPFVHGCVTIPQDRLRELGLFLLPANRDWDRQLSFGASSFVKAIRQYDAIPGETIERLKRELRDSSTRVEEQKELAAILKVVTTEMSRFGLLPHDHELLYRLTSLDAEGILRALVPFIGSRGSTLLPLGRHGSATVALQSFFLILALGQHRIERGATFTLVAEEPELHLHPALHGLLANRLSHRESVFPSGIMMTLTLAARAAMLFRDHRANRADSCAHVFCRGSRDVSGTV